MYVGRFQPWHAGHRWLVDQKLEQGVPVLIAVRACYEDENNPYTALEVRANIETELTGLDVKVIIIPDIESINWGRGVGYELNEWVPPAEISQISATRIRQATN